MLKLQSGMDISSVIMCTFKVVHDNDSTKTLKQCL